MINDGLSGDTYLFTWDAGWLDNYWLVVGNVGEGAEQGHRKTVITLLDDTDTIQRKVEIAPYGIEALPGFPWYLLVPAFSGDE